MTNQTPGHWQEQWKRILFPAWNEAIHYEISNFGHVKSFQNKPKGELIQGSIIQGYRSLNIRHQKESTNRYVHKLVAEYFLAQEAMDKAFVIHIDFDKQNNQAINLRWVNRVELTLHNKSNPAILNRKIPTRTKNYKLTAGKVLIIKQLLHTGKSRPKVIAKQFGITTTQLNRIKKGENWKQIVLK